MGKRRELGSNLDNFEIKQISGRGGIEHGRYEWKTQMVILCTF